MKTTKRRTPKPVDPAWEAEQRRYGVYIPVRLASEANAHAHWRTRQRRAKQQHLVVEATCRGNQVPRLPVPAVVRIVKLGPGLLDTDNLAGAGKHVRDALAAWFGVDDGPTGPIRWEYDQERHPWHGTRIEFRFGPECHLE